MNYKLKYNGITNNIKDGIYLNFEDLVYSIFSRKDYQNLRKIQPISSDFEEWFKEEYPNLSTVTVPQSEIFTQAGAAGKSVVEFKSHSMAADQIKLLTGLVKYELGIKQ